MYQDDSFLHADSYIFDGLDFSMGELPYLITTGDVTVFIKIAASGNTFVIDVFPLLDQF